jgi:hypothetical protein
LENDVNKVPGMYRAKDVVGPQPYERKCNWCQPLVVIRYLKTVVFMQIITKTREIDKICVGAVAENMTNELWENFWF